MGWSVGYDDNWDRDIGYGVPSVCDHPECSEKIDRGLSYVCGGEPKGGERGCGLYFCSKHRSWRDLCSRCESFLEPFSPKPDTQEWIEHKATDASWAEWRKRQDVGHVEPVKVEGE